MTPLNSKAKIHEFPEGTSLNVKKSTSVSSSKSSCHRWCPISSPNFRIAVLALVGDECNVDNHDDNHHLPIPQRHEVHGKTILDGLVNPASSCSLVSIFLISTKGDVASHPLADIQSWCHNHHVSTEITRKVKNVDMLWMDSIFQDVDGVYICGGTKENEVVHLVEQALKAGKHVMVDDPVSSSMSTYHDLIQLAHAQKLQLQETTMFLYHHGLKEFFGYALNESTFGTIRHVQIELDFPEQNFEHVCNLRSFSTPGDIEPYGCINDLARYSALLGILLFRKTNRKPLSARVIKVNRRNGTCISNCECQIQWEGGTTLTMNCNYIESSGGTRQNIEIHSDTHAASLTNFISCRHSLECYRVYEGCRHGRNLSVQQGESIDVDGGPLPEVSLWRRFAEFSTNLHLEEECVATMEEPNSLNRKDFLYATLQSHNVVTALRESVKQDCGEILLPSLDLEFLEY